MEIRSRFENTSGPFSVTTRRPSGLVCAKVLPRQLRRQVLLCTVGAPLSDGSLNEHQVSEPVLL